MNADRLENRPNMSDYQRQIQHLETFGWDHLELDYQRTPPRITGIPPDGARRIEAPSLDEWQAGEGRSGEGRSTET